MSAPQAVVNAVRAVLKRKERDGRTTKNDAVIEVLGKIEKMGGPTKYGIGTAMMLMAIRHIIEAEVSRQFKGGLTEHEYLHVLPAGTPMEFIAALRKVPRWIAINEGSDAEWRFSLRASPDDWRKNAAMKIKKARQTLNRADESEEIAMFLIKHKFSCLEEALTKGV
jgi:hypothetical protein